MLSKNLTLSKKLWVLPVRSFLDALSAWKGLLTGNGGYFVAILKAHIAFIRWWCFHRRKSIFPVKRKAILSGYLNKNIVWQYFGRKKKSFIEIVDKTE